MAMEVLLAAASEIEFRRAIELDPNQAIHRILYAFLLCNTGHSAQALDQTRGPTLPILYGRQSTLQTGMSPAQPLKMIEPCKPRTN
jgi:hypothetical protein